MNEKLTPKEEKVLSSLAVGRLYKEIADENNVKIDAIKKHCKNIYKKLQVRNRTEAAIKYNGGQLNKV